MSIVTVTLNPAIDQTLAVPGFVAGKVNRVQKSQSHAAGKGVNVAAMLADLGASPVVTGLLGRDNADVFEVLFVRKRIADQFVRIDGATRIGIKVVDDTTGTTTDINFPGLAPDEADLAELQQRIERLAHPGDWFVLSGSLPPGVSTAIFQQMTQTIRAKGASVLLDTSGEPFKLALAASPQVVKPNIAELSEALGRTLTTPSEVADVAKSHLLSRGISLAVVSMGGDGAVFITRERSLLAVPPKVMVKSTVGAGDAMVAGLVYAQHAGLSLESTARLATALGTYAVTRVGSGLESPAAHEHFINDIQLLPIE